MLLEDKTPGQGAKCADNGAMEGQLHQFLGSIRVRLSVCV